MLYGLLAQFLALITGIGTLVFLYAPVTPQANLGGIGIPCQCQG